MKILALVAACGLLLSACGVDPQIVKQMKVPHGTDIGVIPFRDCIIAGQEDCDRSGGLAGSVFVRVFSEDGFRAVLLSRPVAPKEPLSDDAAIALAKAKNLAFVINGEVSEFYDVAPMTFRPDRAGISVRILSVETGKIAASYSDIRASKTNFRTPESLIMNMAEEVRDELE
ncbi:MAG: hypothetical protein ABIP67_17120 [Burkholderiales bacterium]